MKERQVQREVTLSVKAWGGYSACTQDATVCPKCKHMIVPSRGRPDFFCYLGRYGFVVEVKSAALNFSFSDLGEKQREWGQWFVMDRHSDWYLWLSMGTRLNHPEYPRRTWLIPLRDFLAVEAIVREYQKSIPYQAGKGHNVEMQLRHIDAVHLLAPYELERRDGVWWLPVCHALSDKIERPL